MWTRVEIKTRAKEVLKKTYWVAFVISFILFIAGAGYSYSGGNGSNDRNSSNRNFQTRYNFGNMDVTDYNISFKVPGSDNLKIYTPNPIYGSGFAPIWMGFLVSLFGFALLALALLSLFFRIIAGYHLQVGGYKYFIQTAEDREGSFRDLGMGFKSRHYFNILKTMFLRDLYNFLWFLLFIIPGIIKIFAYAFVPYILADNPEIESGRAIQISKEMTQGHKMDMFILGLSFLGWYILGSIAFGIGVAFVWPYDNATHAQLYLILRQDAIANGIASMDELGI